MPDCRPADTHIAVKDKKDNADKLSQVKVTTGKFNKRFQPQYMPPIGFVWPETRNVQYHIKAVSKPKDYLLFSLILSQSLRGPPQIAC